VRHLERKAPSPPWDRREPEPPAVEVDILLDSEPRIALHVALLVFLAILAYLGNLARLGRLPRTRPIVPGELAVSD